MTLRAITLDMLTEKSFRSFFLAKSGTRKKATQKLCRQKLSCLAAMPLQYHNMAKKVLDFCLLSVSLAVVQAKKFKLLTEDSNRTFNFIIERCLRGKFFYFYCPQFLLRLFKGQFLSQSQENWPGKFHQMLSQLHVHNLAPVSQLELQNHFVFVWV